VATPPTNFNCGDMMVSFAYLDGGALDYSIFNVETGSSPYKFEVK
jgi:hypothetical protein